MHLLIVEDKDSFRRLLVQSLANTAWNVQAVGCPEEALALLGQQHFDVMATDLRLPGSSGLALLKQAKRVRPDIRVVLMSAFGEARDIVEAMQNGADDFLPKPFDLDLFQQVLARIQSLVAAPPPDPREAWITHSTAMRELDQSLQKAALSDLPVLFTGESSVGKRRSARRLHGLRHPHAPFLLMDAASLSPMSLDSDRLTPLQGGSIHLSDLEALSDQGLTALRQAMESDPGRAIHWTGSALAMDSVPPPLRDKLGVLFFHIPPLRERKEDILPLFRLFLNLKCKAEGRSSPLVEKAAEKDLMQRAWQGNIQELEWCAHQAIGLLQGAVVGPIPQPSAGPSTDTMNLTWPPHGTLEAMLHQVIKDAESQILRRFLQENGGDPAPTAAALGLSTRSLAQRLREHGIPLDDSL